MPREIMPTVRRVTADALMVPRSDSPAAAVVAAGHVFRGTRWAGYTGKARDRDADPAGLRLGGSSEAQGAASAARPAGVAPPLPVANQSDLARIYGPAGVDASMASNLGSVNDCSQTHALLRDRGAYVCQRCGAEIDRQTYLSGYAVTTRTKSRNLDSSC